MATTSNSSMDYQEDLFQAIDTIVQARIADLPYDKTIECKVIDISKATKGIYIVEYENAKFEATSNIKNLEENDVVYVQIPLGDFRKNKIIIALKSRTNILDVKALPFLSFIKGHNIFSTLLNVNVYNIKMNSDKEADMQFVFTLFDNADLAYGYTRMGIKASISTNVNNKLVSGDYGIKITIYGYDLKQISANYGNGDLLVYARAHRDDPKYYKTFTLTKSDMIGTNLYNTHGYLNQEKIFDISGWVIDNITVTLWQNNLFEEANGNRIKDKLISFTGLSLYLGYDINEFKTQEIVNSNSSASEIIQAYLEQVNNANTAMEEANIVDLFYEKLTITENNSSNKLYYIRLRTKDGMLYETPLAGDIIKKHYEIYCLWINKDTNTFTDISYKIKNVFFAIELYNPTNLSISLRSNKYSFDYIYGGLIDSELNLFGEQELIINANGEFVDLKKNGYCILIFSRNSSSTAINFLQELEDVLDDPSTLYLSSNELWFVHTDEAKLLDTLITSDLTEETDDISFISGNLIYTGPEILFKASDGTVVLRLNVNNTLLYGNALTATAFKDNNNNSYNLYETLKNIEQALRNLGSDYQLLTE